MNSTFKKSIVMLLFLLFFIYFKIYLITYIIDVPLVATLISLAMGCIIYIFSLMENIFTQKRPSIEIPYGPINAVLTRDHKIRAIGKI